MWLPQLGGAGYVPDRYNKQFSSAIFSRKFECTRLEGQATHSCVASDIIRTPLPVVAAFALARTKSAGVVVVTTFPSLSWYGLDIMINQFLRSTPGGNGLLGTEKTGFYLT